MPTVINITLCSTSQPGYLPVDPQIVADRMTHLEESYQELLELARGRKDRLGESRKLWQFFWDLADDENMIKEQAQIMSSTDIGHDLTSINLLIKKQKVSTMGRRVFSVTCLNSLGFFL